jgi:uracil-DNA glycosylase family protein
MAGDNSGADASSFPGAAEFIPVGVHLDALRSAAQACRGCHLYENATQTVFSAGSATARIVLVGEQPGDQEDRRGEPFVGPAGVLLDRALADAGIDRERAYVTNAVKHFKFTQAGEGKRRIHQTPDVREVRACKPWLDTELSLLDPDVVVALGATAGKSLMGNDFRVTRSRGVLMEWPTRGAESARHNAFFLATIHPSAVLRADDRDTAYAGLVSDLVIAAQAIA